MRDTGVGIPPDKLDSVFGQFEQVDSSATRRQGGTGLGLAIGQKLVQLMGGDIRVESELGRGSHFYFDACFESVEADPNSGNQDPAVRDLATAAGQEIRLAVCDPHQLSREITLGMIRNWGVGATGCETAAQANSFLSATISEQLPLVLIVDVMVPPEGRQAAEPIDTNSGLNLLRELAAAGPRVQFVALTARNDPELTRQLKSLGVAEQLLKPAKESELFDALLRCVGVDPAPRQQAELLGTHSNAVRPLNVLLVEDNIINQKLAIGLLAKQHHRVQVASDGLEAIDLFQENVFDLILMDIQMPRLDGLAATREIRRLEETRLATDSDYQPVPIIAMTARTMSEDREQCVSAGMNAYLSKPIRPPNLYAAIAKLCQHTANPAGNTADTGNTAKPAGKNQEALAENTSLAGSLVDWQEALDTVGSDRQLLADLIRIFRQESDNMLKEILQAIDHQDMRELRRTAHAFKSSLQHLGVRGAAGCARRLELLAESDSDSEDASLMETARKIFDELRLQVVAALSELAAFTIK